MSLHLSQLGRTARTARLGRTASSSNSCECHGSHASSLASSRTSTVGAVGVARRSKVAALRCSYTRRRARTCSSTGGGARPARSLSRRTPSCIPSLPGWRSSCGAFSPESGYAGSPPDLRPIQVLRKGLVTGSLLRRACAPIVPISSTASTPSGGSTLPILISNEQSTSYSQSLFNRHFYYNTRAFIYNSRLRPLYHT